MNSLYRRLKSTAEKNSPFHSKDREDGKENAYVKIFIFIYIQYVNCLECWGQ